MATPPPALALSFGPLIDGGLKPDRGYLRVALREVGRSPGRVGAAAAIARAWGTEARAPIGPGGARLVAEVAIAAAPLALDLGLAFATGTLIARVDATALAGLPRFVAVVPADSPLRGAALELIGDRLGQGGVPIAAELDFALFELAAVKERDLAALAELAAGFDEVQRAHAARDDAALDGAYEDTLARIAAHAQLITADRNRLAARLRDLASRPFAYGAVPAPALAWPDITQTLAKARDVVPFAVDRFALGGMELGASPRSQQPPAAPEPLQWNTRLLDGAAPIVDGRVVVAHPYTLTTELSTILDDSAIASVGVPIADLPDGAPVQFTVACAAAILTDLATPGAAATAQVSGTVPFDAANRRCGPMRVSVTARAPGPLVLELGLVTGNALRMSARVRLTAFADAAIGTTAPAEPLPTAIAVAAGALRGPSAEISVNLLPSDELLISIGALQGRPIAPADSLAARQQRAVQARRDLVAVSNRYQPAAGDPFGLVDGRARMFEIARLGAALHRAFFGAPGDNGDPTLAQLAKRIADTGGHGAPVRMQITAAFQPYPWAIFYDGACLDQPLARPEDVDPMRFWGRRFRIDRTCYGNPGAGRAPVIRAPARVQPCLNAHLDDEQAAAGVHVLAAQRAMFGALAGAHPYPWIESTANLRAFLAGDAAPCDVLYVFCHALAAASVDALFTYATKAPDVLAQLFIEPGVGLPVEDMRGLRHGPLRDGPLVFLNACTSAAGDQAFQGQFLEQFVSRWGAIGFVGTDWEVPTVFADAFARAVLAQFLAPCLPIGDALAHATDLAFAQDNPFPLIYALYGPPDLTVQGAPP